MPKDSENEDLEHFQIRKTNDTLNFRSIFCEYWIMFINITNNIPFCMDAETVQSLCDYIEHVSHDKLLQLVETGSIEMYSQFQKNIGNLFNAYVLTQRPEEQRQL